MSLWDREKIDADALYEQGEQYYNAENYDKALECYETAANYGVPDAMYSLGFCYAYGKGVQQDYNAALYWYHEAVDNGSAKAMYQLGRMYEEGTGVELDYIQAAEYYQEAAHLGHIDAQLMMGNCYATGTGVTPDYDRAIAFWSMAANQGSKEAQHNIEWVGYCNNEELAAAKSLIYGTDGFEKDIQFGLDLVKKGIRLNDAEAIHFMGRLLIFGLPGYIDADVDAGLANIIDAAHNGEVKALYDMIEIHKNGCLDGVPVEMDDASFGKAVIEVAQNINSDEYGANWGYAYAAWAYAYGYGVGKSETMAMQWIDRLPNEMKKSEFIKSLPLTCNDLVAQESGCAANPDDGLNNHTAQISMNELLEQAENGDVSAMLALGERLYNPDKYTDLELSAMWDTKAAEAGSKEGMLRAATSNHLLGVANRLASISDWDASADFEQKAVKWAKEAMQISQLDSKQRDIISQTVADATYGWGYSLFLMKQYDEAVDVLKQLHEPKSLVLQAVCIYSRDDTSENLRLAYQMLKSVEESRDYAITQKSDEEEIVFAIATCYLSTFYRCGLSGVVAPNIKRAVGLLERTQRVLREDGPKNYITKELKKYRKQLFGGYQYLE